MADDGLPDLTERLRIRRRHGRRQGWRPVVIACGVLLLALLAQWVVHNSGLLKLSRVQTTGTHLVQDSQVQDAARLPLGAPLAQVDLDAVARRVAAINVVDHVQVQRHWPHTITIAVTERVAAYQRRTTSGYQWVDAHGIVFNSLATSTRGLVTATTNGVDNQLLTGVAQAIGALTPATRAQVSAVDAPTANDIVLTLTGGRRVTWGGADQSDVKSKVLQALLNQPVRTIDVSSPTHPTGR